MSIPRWLGIKPTWVMMPEVIPDAAELRTA